MNDTAPPITPDPALVANAEGNQRILASDLAAIREYLAAQGSAPAPTPQPLVTIDGDLLREVCRVQHDKTLQAVRDLVDGLKVTTPSTRGYGTDGDENTP